MVIKCKICGGDVAFTPGDTYGTCAFCGSTSTIPQGDDEQKLNLYNRANHFRRQGEFDKALAAYERLLEQDDTDAEAHWGAALSRYGIEYVEDPATKKRIPTCHRLQVASILADVDYKAAVAHAPDAESRRLYEEEAARIAEIQKGILTISQNEKPYDVFICYKETDENGQRTHDSQWAQEVYYGLTEQGYKVFFSRITLEDKLGQEYEPYIFAALNSARVMLVIGSKPEYFNAVWVRNEWSRYLTLMANDRKRLLIPCYRGMDPYDLPDELSSLQSQDMSKIGFMQDLLRGVRKVLEVPKAQEKPAPAPVPAAPEAPVRGSVENLMKRVRLFLEDGDFRQADEYLDKVLDQDAEYAPAYAAKVCVKLKLGKESDLAEADPAYENDPDWKKALRFANPQQAQTYQGYIRHAKQKATYEWAMAIWNNAHNSVDQLKRAADEFDSIKDYRDAKAQADQCRQEAAELAVKNRQIAEARRAAAYDKIIRMMAEAGNQSGKWSAIQRELKNADLNGYRDVEELRAQAAARYEACVAEEKKQRQQAEEQRQREAAAAAAKKKRNTLIGILAAVIVIAAIIVVTQVIIPGSHYRNAVALQQAGKYEEAIKAFEALNGYSDSATQIEACRNSIKEREYQAAKALQQAGKYEEAIAAFEALENYSDAATQIKDLVAAAAREEKLKPYKTAGSYVTFGTYPQTESGTDNTPIEWLVLEYDAKNNRALVISRYGLDTQPYNTKSTDTTWEKSSMRSWLNSTFMDKAFSTKEQSAIVQVKVDNSKSQGYSGWSTSGGNNTQDKIFLLSYAEANKYFGVQHYSVEGSKNNTESRVTPTAYAKKQGAYTNDSYKTTEGSAAGWWWLRSPGNYHYYAARVDTYGSLSCISVSYVSGCVRPALWINLESDIF